MPHSSDRACEEGRSGQRIRRQAQRFVDLWLENVAAWARLPAAAQERPAPGDRA